MHVFVETEDLREPVRIEYTGCCFRLLFETFPYRPVQWDFRSLHRHRAHEVRRNLLRSLRGQMRRKDGPD